MISIHSSRITIRLVFIQIYHMENFILSPATQEQMLWISTFCISNRDNDENKTKLNFFGEMFEFYFIFRYNFFE